VNSSPSILQLQLLALAAANFVTESLELCLSLTKASLKLCCTIATYSCCT